MEGHTSQVFSALQSVSNQICCWLSSLQSFSYRQDKMTIAGGLICWVGRVLGGDSIVGAGLQEPLQLVDWIGLVC